jgi:hypothetical protein
MLPEGCRDDVRSQHRSGTVRRSSVMGGARPTRALARSAAVLVARSDLCAHRVGPARVCCHLAASRRWVGVQPVRAGPEQSDTLGRLCPFGRRLAWRMTYGLTFRRSARPS